MARISTKTGVANLTLTLLKNDTVTSIDPPDTGSKAAKLCALWYEDSRREVLSETIWDHAVKRVGLPAHPTAPDFGYSTKYELPADYIRVASIGDEDDPEEDYEIEDGFLLINATGDLDFRYVYDHEDISKWSPKYLQSVARKLGANICYGLTGNRTFAAEMEALYREYVGEGRTVDSQQNPPRRIQRSRWKQAKEVGLGDSRTSGRIVI